MEGFKIPLTVTINYSKIHFSLIRDRKKSFQIFFNYVRTVLKTLSNRMQKTFFEIQPGTRFFDLISILVPQQNQ